MHGAGRLERYSQRRPINPENRGWFLIDPIAIWQFIVVEPPCDVGVLAFISLERNVEQWESHRGRDQNQTGNDENRLSCRRTRSQTDCAFDHREREVTVSGSAVSRFLITVLR